MKTKSNAGGLVRKTAADLKRPTAAELARLRAAMNAPIDTSEIAEQSMRGRYVLVRDGKGRIPRKPASPIRDAILAELGRRKMTRYELWKRARRRCRTLSNSAVYEYLLGHRAIGVDYCEALLIALELGVTRLRKSA